MINPPTEKSLRFVTPVSAGWHSSFRKEAAAIAKWLWRLLAGTRMSPGTRHTSSSRIFLAPPMRLLALGDDPRLELGRQLVGEPDRPARAVGEPQARAPCSGRRSFIRFSGGTEVAADLSHWLAIEHTGEKNIARRRAISHVTS
jgi:hypothetical protein